MNNRIFYTKIKPNLSRIDGTTVFQEYNENKIEKSYQPSQSHRITRAKVYACQQCEVTFERSYQLKRHCFIGDHRKKRLKPQATITQTPVRTTQPIAQQTFKLLSTTVAQNNGITATNQKPNITYIRNTLINGSQPPLQHKKTISVQINCTEQPNGIAESSPKFKVNGPIQTYSNRSRAKVNLELPASPGLSCDSRTTMQTDDLSSHSGDQYIGRNGNSTITFDKPKAVSVAMPQKYFTVNHEHDWNQIIYYITYTKPNTFDEMLLRCAVCNFVHSDLHIIDNHLTLHNGTPFRFQCQLCDDWFGQLEHLMNHVYGHTAPSDCYKCDWCSKIFNSSEDFIVHTAGEEPACTFDASGRQLFQCDVCRKTFVNAHLFRSHNTIMHNGGKPYKCNTCSTEFFYLASLTKHHECNAACDVTL